MITTPPPPRKIRLRPKPLTPKQIREQYHLSAMLIAAAESDPEKF